MTLVFALLVWFTNPLSWGDSDVYARQLVGFSKGLVEKKQIWEFGHLFWRPIGYLIWQSGEPYWARQFGGNQALEVCAAMRVPSVLLGYLAALASFGVAWRISGSVLAGALVGGAFLGWNPIVNYLKTASAYVPGLALQLAGLCLLLGDSQGRRYRGRAWLAGAVLALSVCLWFPYLFGLPGIFLLAYLWQRAEPASNGNEGRRRLLWVAQAVAACALVGIVSFAAGMSIAGIRSPEQLKMWVADSGHGYQFDKKYLRVAVGLPRGLVDVGEDGRMLKRFVLRDPYAPVGVFELFRTTLWKLPLFYAGLAALIWMLARDRAARPVFLSLCVSGGVMLFFGVVVFESGASERWMPAFAALLAAIAFVFRGRKPFRIGVLPLAILLAVAWIGNFAAHATASEPGPENPAVARLLSARPALAPQSVICLLSFRDEIGTFRLRFPFHPLNRQGGLTIYPVTEAGSGSSARWRENFAAYGLGVWERNGDIWISKRMIAERPLPEWGWVESDDPHLKWRDVAAFFRAYAFEGDVGGPDGFLRVARSQANLARLEGTARSGGRAD